MSGPAACGAQCGAPRPASAGTNVTPPESGTVPATRVEGGRAVAGAPISVSQRSADPAVYTCPSRQYVAVPASRQATEADRPAVDLAALSPVVTSRNAPVP